MNWALGLALTVVALSATAFTWAGISPRARATHQYRCEQSRHIIAFERRESVSLMVAGRNYDLQWIDASTARGQGLIWRVSNGNAVLTRVSSGFALASGCARVNALL
jgi:hypothetical protein